MASLLSFALPAVPRLPAAPALPALRGLRYLAVEQLARPLVGLANLPTLRARAAYFFDRAAVRAMTDRHTRRALGHAGGYLRRVARNSMKVRRGASPPGKPPHAHTRLLKDFIFYAYDPAAESVVVGPVRTNQVFFSADRRPIRGTVPGVLEHGGQVRVLEVEVRPGYWRRGDLRSLRRNATRPQRLRTVTIAPRPYMQPALAATTKKLPSIWAGSVADTN